MRFFKGEGVTYEVQNTIKEEERDTKVMAIIDHPLKKSSRIQLRYLTAFLLSGTF